MSEIPRYGVKEALSAHTEFEVLGEELRLLGYATLQSGLSPEALENLSVAFDRGETSYRQKAARNGFDLALLQENDTIRVLPLVSPEFWDVVFNQNLHDLLKQLLGDYYILNQVNGLINRANKTKYHQAAYHRDLPYQHFVVSRPIAINALFAIDDFTIENGATRIIPASHHLEAFPSDGTIRHLERQITVRRGTFIILDCMLFHAGSTNRSTANRRAVNHVFTIPLMRQQLHLPSVIGTSVEFLDWQRRILGFGLDEYRTVEQWLASRAAKP